MKRIIVEKGDGIVEIIDQIIGSSDDTIILVIPKGSVLTKSASNFRLLKREAGLAEKKVAVESPDGEIIQLAEENGVAIAGRMEAGVKLHPHAGVSDIVAKNHGSEADDDYEPTARSAKKAGVSLTVHTEDDSDDDDEDKKSFLASDRFFKPRSIPPARTDDDEDDENPRGGSRKVIGWIIAVLVVLGIAFYGISIVFGRAQVTIHFTQTPWSYQANSMADKAIATTTVGANGTMVIPAQVFTTQKNITQLFQATGKSETVSSKAQGTITIYNHYSASSQDLVATTRFVTPDGKIFRLMNDVTVPGATVAADGTITASSIDAPIIADQGGVAYNVGPVPKLTIPGFQSSAGKYAGFYGEIKGQTTGGATGVKPIPTAADVSAAKASTTAILEADLQGGFAASYPNNFKIVDGATSVAVSKLTVNTSTDANGNFSVFGQASLTAIGFDESALEAYLLGLAQSQSAGQTTLSFKNINVSYTNVVASFSKGQVTFSLSAQGTLEPAFSADQFASSVAGKSIAGARDAIQSLPELSDGKISVWPIWLWSMPGNPGKIQVTVD
jgi:hypothetical protein